MITHIDTFNYIDPFPTKLCRHRTFHVQTEFQLFLTLFIIGKVANYSNEHLPHQQFFHFTLLISISPDTPAGT